MFLHKLFLVSRSLSAATPGVVQQRALEGLSASQRSRGSRVAEPPPVRCVHALFSSPGGWRCVPERTALMRRADSQPSTDTSPQRLRAADNHEEPLQGAERFTWGRLSAEAEWRGVGGDLWPLRILFWRILSDDRTVRMRTWSLTVKLNLDPS